MPKMNSRPDWVMTDVLDPIKQAIKPIMDSIVDLGRKVSRVADGVPPAIFRSISDKHLRNLRIVRVGEVINDPHAIIRDRIQQALRLDSFRCYQIVSAFRNSKATAVAGILDDYLDRADRVELAMSALLGSRLPIVEAISKDIHTLLGRGGENDFPAAILTLLDGVSDTMARVLRELGVIAGNPGGAMCLRLDVGSGHFYDWVTCNTKIDRDEIGDDKHRRTQQQRLRYTMLKVILSHIEDVDLSPRQFRSGGASTGEAATSGGFPLSSTTARSVFKDSDGLMRAYAGLFAAAFEHVFVSARPLDAEGADAPSAASDLYHDLPFTLKLQRPDLARLALGKPGCSPFGADGVDLELDSEFLAMKLATNSACLSSGIARTAINCIANGIWEISPNNPPLVETIASMIAIPIHEIEKAIVYDIFRRFRIYVTDQRVDTSHEFVLMHASIRVPDFSGKGTTEKELKAVIALACTDGALLQGLRQLMPDLPLCLDEAQEEGARDKVTELLHGMMKDALAVCYVASS